MFSSRKSTAFIFAFIFRIFLISQSSSDLRVFLYLRKRPNSRILPPYERSSRNDAFVSKILEFRRTSELPRFRLSTPETFEIRRTHEYLSILLSTSNAKLEKAKITARRRKYSTKKGGHRVSRGREKESRGPACDVTVTYITVNPAPEKYGANNMKYFAFNGKQRPFRWLNWLARLKGVHP